MSCLLVNLSSVTACTSGTYGQNCTLNCPENCRDGACHRENGTCTNGCKDGYYETDGCDIGEIMILYFEKLLKTNF